MYSRRVVAIQKATDQDDSDAGHSQAPPWWLTLLEAPRALTEASTLIPARSFLKTLGVGDGHAVMALPGFLATDRSTRVLREYCRHWGYDSHPWEQGRNLGLTTGRDLEQVLDARLEYLYQRSGGKVSLIGWSLGGLFAREMARRNPEKVRLVITLGSPLGNPRATNAWRLYEFLSGTSIDEERIRKRVRALRDPLNNVPVTAIYSRTDAIVSWQISRLPEGKQVENLGISTSHLGMGFNPAVLYAIADRLRLPEGRWAPFEIRGFRNLFFH
ncbi:MAG: alpha/beta hydrolase [Gammaproteobacteria bacterium]|nr:alpha/beta hydrolase [Gammaproteobacteria bacterium]MDH4315119.1 alpha/beta hydrolase [Gammaproteobacteria bacterium]MDH5214258.1 alpha/beta hydrolase [Gammaproteobacteria bacterium]